jgi:hypothetical protein
VPRIVELVKTRIPRCFGLDPIRDIQVLCPMNRGGAGARSLNIELQAVGAQSARPAEVAHDPLIASFPWIVSLPFTEAQAQHRAEIGQPAS